MSGCPYSTDLDEMSAACLAIQSVLAGLEYAPQKTVEAVIGLYPDPEQDMALPAISILGETMEIAADSLSPHILESTWVQEQRDGWVLAQDGEAVCQCSVVVWATDGVARSRILRAVRERLQDTMSGLYGVVVHVADYVGGVDAIVTPLSVRYDDNPDAVRSRNRIATMAIEVRLPILRVQYAPPLDGRVRAEVIGPTEELVT